MNDTMVAIRVTPEHKENRIMTKKWSLITASNPNSLKRLLVDLADLK